MKLIHCADIHLGSPMNATLDADKAKQRKNELLQTFERLVSYAAKENVRAILIAGDMFDSNRATKTVKSIVRRSIEEHPSIDFLYLRGNHDDALVLYDEEAPENLKLFSTEWTTYRYGDVSISGIEMGNTPVPYDSLVLEPSAINLVMMHGQETSYAGKDKTEVIRLPHLRNKGIDYLALGHVHAGGEGMIDRRGKWRYAGCLDGRGFDECGPKGFILLEIEGGKLTDRFVEMESRRIENVAVDISGARDTADVDRLVAKELGAREPDEMLKVSLTGRVGVEVRYDLDYIASKYKDRFFAFRMEDKDVGLCFNIDDYRYDASLKGEFIRRVLSAEAYSEEEKRLVIDEGLRALSGEGE